MLAFLLLALAAAPPQAPPLKEDVARCQCVVGGCHCAANACVCNWAEGKVCAENCPCILALGYEAARAESVRTGRPLVIFVGLYKARPLHGCITTLDDGKRFPQVSGGVGVVIGLPQGGDCYFAETLQEVPPDDELLRRVTAARLPEDPPAAALAPVRYWQPPVQTFQTFQAGWSAGGGC